MADYTINKEVCDNLNIIFEWLYKTDKNEIMSVFPEITDSIPYEPEKMYIEIIYKIVGIEESIERITNHIATRNLKLSMHEYLKYNTVDDFIGICKSEGLKIEVWSYDISDDKLSF